jgi:serine/threonine-protein kinase
MIPQPRSLGRYELVAHLATGGMGDVHLARMAGPAGFERWVVVKVLLPELAPSARFRDMFFHEARLAARLSHPNVCEVLDLGEDAGTYYIVMPYLDGIPFAALMDRPAALSASSHRRAVAGVIAQACDGLHHAHQMTDADGTPLGVVHRDVSPSNVMVLRDGVVKVLDFGIAKSRTSTTVTERDVIKGKPAYMSPEQLAEGAVDRRADIFCAGILLYEAVTGRRLYARDGAIATARAVLEDPVPTAADLPDVPAPLADVIARALAKQPYQRFATAEQLKRELVGAMSADGGPMDPAELADLVTTHWSDALRPPPSIDVRPAAPSVTQTASQAVTFAIEPKRETTRWWALGVLASAMVAAAIAVAWIASRDPDPVVLPAAPLTGSSTGSVAAPVEVPPVVDPAIGSGAGASEPIDRPRDRRSRDRTVVRDERPGFVSIDSDPWATIYIDGQRIGVTPVIGREVKSGKRQIRAVLEDGRDKRVTVDVTPGSQNPVRLRW